MTIRLTQGLWQRFWAAPVRYLPSQCAVCNNWGRQRICLDCTTRFSDRHARCSRCAMSLPELSRGQPVAPVCGQCVLHPPPLDACAAAVDYAFPWDRLIAHLKFSPRHRADAALARPLADLLCAQPRVIELLLQADVVLPMPLSRQRLSDRGFNQSLLLCQHLLGSPRVRHQPRPQLQQQWLLRTVDTLPQHDLPRSQRLVNVRNAFAIDPLCSAFLHQKRVVIVDDVMTTGASMFAAAQCVHQAGAAHVAGIVLARTALAT